MCNLFQALSLVKKCEEGKLTIQKANNFYTKGYHLRPDDLSHEIIEWELKGRNKVYSLFCLQPP